MREREERREEDERQQRPQAPEREQQRGGRCGMSMARRRERGTERGERKSMRVGERAACTANDEQYDGCVRYREPRDGMCGIQCLLSQGPGRLWSR